MECEIAFLQHFFLVTLFFSFIIFVAVEFGSLYPHSMSCYQTVNTAEIKSTQAHAMTLLVCARLTLIFYAKLLIIGIFYLFLLFGFFSTIFFCWKILEVHQLLVSWLSISNSVCGIPLPFSFVVSLFTFIIIFNLILTNWGGVEGRGRESLCIWITKILPVKTNCLQKKQQQHYNNILGNYSLLKPNIKQTKEPSTLNINLSFTYIFFCVLFYLSAF